MRNPKIEEHRISVDKYFNNNELVNYGGEAYTFIEDLRLGILSYSDKDKMDISLSPDNPEFEKILLNSYQTSDSCGGNSLCNFIFELINEIVSDMTYFGFIIYEIIKPDKKAFYFSSIRNTYKLEIKNDYVLQHIPEELQSKGLPKIVKIPKGNCMVFSIPDELGGYKKHIETLNYLNSDTGINAYGDLSLNKFAGKFDEYDFMKHIELLDIASWKVTSYIGWDHRKYRDNKCGLEHYRYGRLLKFKKSRIIIRDNIVSELNKTIKKLSKEYIGKEIELKINGLITLFEINDAIGKWYKGKMGFDELNKLL